MTKNRLLHLRKSRGLTQRALAELAGTSQQQIQRIEAGIQGVRLELAIAIAAAVNCQLVEVFPALAGAQTRQRKISSPQRDEAHRKARFLEAGIDPDPAQWTVKFFTYDGRVFLYEISSEEKSRLEQRLSAGESNSVVFTTDKHRVGVNPKKIAATQFLFDFGDFGVESAPEAEDEKYELKLHLVAAKEPVVFDVEPDQRSLDEDDDGDGSLCQLQDLFFYLDMGQDEILSFDDVDGERVYIRATEILAIEAPLVCCDPALWKAQFEGYLEDEEAKKTSSPSEKVDE
jgi:transcriptional regulator with XRE-family HTH domain